MQAYVIGLVHGMGGSAGVGVLLLAAIPDRAEAAVALALFAAFTAVSMALASSTFGYALTRPPVLRRFATVAPLMGALSLTFGVWYSLGALNAVPYVF
jgi:FtsH-binding integral membrane protein